jgi:hypothetical protein
MTHWLSKALLVLASLTYLCPLAVHAQAVEDRVAFIIGNGGYPKSFALKNPINDATAIEKQLVSLGFETKSYKDLKVAEASLCSNLALHHRSVAGHLDDKTLKL